MVARSHASTAPVAAARNVGARIGLSSLALAGRFGLMLSAAGLLIASIFYSYWHIVLHAPQYPKGLFIDVFVNKMEPKRNVFEVDGLNHYIGMIKLTDAATLERAISVYAIPIVALVAVASVLIKGRWSWLLRVPMILYPVIFAVDLFAWLYYAGHSLDPHAPMSSSIKEFTPRIFGDGRIGQFRTEAQFETGFYLAAAAALIALAVTIWDWRSRDARSS
jgi:hypothetical protein